LAHDWRKAVTFNVKTGKNSYPFEGPFTSAAGLKEKSGVYAITTLTSGDTHKVLDVGESGNVYDRVSNHDRATEWKRHEVHGIYMSAYYCAESTRMAIERELRTYFNPPCGSR
jgi:hypothetical protein